MSLWIMMPIKTPYGMLQNIKDISCLNWKLLQVLVCLVNDIIGFALKQRPRRTLALLCKTPTTHISTSDSFPSRLVPPASCLQTLGKSDEDSYFLDWVPGSLPQLWTACSLNCSGHLRNEPMHGSLVSFSPIPQKNLKNKVK